MTAITAIAQPCDGAPEHRYVLYPSEETQDPYSVELAKGMYDLNIYLTIGTRCWRFDYAAALKMETSPCPDDTAPKT